MSATNVKQIVRMPWLALWLVFVVVPVSAQTSLQELADQLLDDESYLEDPTDIMAWVTLPRAAKPGQEVELVVTVENARSKRSFRLRSLDLADSFLDGFSVTGYEPKPSDQDHSLGTLTLEYPVTIAPGGQQSFTIHLTAKKVGAFIGDIDVYEGDQFLTRALQTRISE